MNNFPLFATLAAVTVASPGPGVLLTLTNALRHGMARAFLGIAGISMGAMAMAAVSASGLGLVVSSSPGALAALKYIGAAYLFYLGWKAWNAPNAAGPGNPAWASREGAARTRLGHWKEGVTLQFTNPKPLLFFVSILPQFVDGSRSQGRQYAALVLTYSLLVVVIHGGYALAASQAQRVFASPRAGMMVRRASGGCFVFFGAMLLAWHP